MASTGPGAVDTTSCAEWTAPGVHYAYPVTGSRTKELHKVFPARSAGTLTLPDPSGAAGRNKGLIFFSGFDGWVFRACLIW